MEAITLTTTMIAAGDSNIERGVSDISQIVTLWNKAFKYSVLPVE